jgi:hypothetical protein
LDFLELRKRAQAGWFGFPGAASARDGQQNESGSDKCGKDADHGSDCGRISEKSGECRMPDSLRGSHVNRWGGGGCARAAGGGKEGGGSGDKCEFHL